MDPADSKPYQPSVGAIKNHGYLYTTTCYYVGLHVKNCRASRRLAAYRPRQSVEADAGLAVGILRQPLNRNGGILRVLYQTFLARWIVATSRYRY